MLTSIILALSVSATPVTSADTLDLLQNNNNDITTEVVARKSVRLSYEAERVARKSVRLSYKAERTARKSVRLNDSSSKISTSL